MSAPQWEIVCRRDEADDAGGWSSDSIGSGNLFATEKEALDAIDSLIALGGDWHGPRYAIRQVGTSRAIEYEV